MANIEKIKVGNTSYDIRDASALQNLTSAQETQLLADGTYNGEAVANGTVFTTDEGKFKEFSAGEPTLTTKTAITTINGSHAKIGCFKGVYYQIQSNKCYYSEDNCTTWTATTITDVSSSGSAYVYGPVDNGSLALVIIDGAIAGSSDGKNWEKLSNIPAAFGNIFCFAGKFYITNNAYNQLYSSSDGVTWTQVTLPSGVSSTFSVTGTATRLVVIPAYNSTWYYTEDNGANWTSFTPTGAAYSAPSIYTYSSNVLGEKTFVKTESVWNFTTDGTSYTQVSTSAINSLDFPTFGYCSAAGLYVCLDSTSSWKDKYYTSTDGITWTEYSRPSQQNVYLACSPMSFMMSTGSYTSNYNFPVYFGSLLNLTDLTPTVTVDQTYNSSSANAQSGVAIAGAGFLKNADSTSTNLSIKSSDNTVRLSATGGSVIKSEGYSVSIGYNPSGSTNYATKVGTECYTTQFGTAIGYGASAGGYYSIAIGTVSSPSHHVYASGLYSIAMGYEASASQDYGVCIGPYTEASTSASAFGRSAKATASYAIQIGKGTNSTANTFSVGLSDSNNYQLLDSAGIIPTARMPSDVLKNEATGTDSWRFAGATTDGNERNYSLAIGPNAVNTSNYSMSIGYNARASGNGLSIGLNARAWGGSFYSVAIGTQATIGSSPSTAAQYATAIGSFATVTANGAIQIGYGTNSTAQTLNVGFYDPNTTLNYQLLDSTGKIPDGRLPIATSVDSTSTNAQVVGAKLFYDTCGNITALINAL